MLLSWGHVWWYVDIIRSAYNIRVMMPCKLCNLNVPVSGSLRLTKASVSEYDPRAAEWAKTEVTTRFHVKIWV